MFRYLVIFLSVIQLFATQEFNLESLKGYMDKNNPYIYKEFAQTYVKEQQLNFFKGEFDTKLNIKYDEKDYPTSDGSYQGVFVKKPTQSGIDLSVGYRYAEGVQEYNNIKTAKDGETIFGAEIPIVSLLNNIDTRRLNVRLAKMGLEGAHYKYQNAMRTFYFNLIVGYYTVLYYHEVQLLNEQILQKIAKREEFVERNVYEGNLPNIALIEAKQQVLNAKQNYISSQRFSENELTKLLKFLPISLEEFHKKYHLPSLPQSDVKNYSLTQALELATQNRPDLKMLQIEKEKLLLNEKNNQVNKYPDIDLGVYGVSDSQNESGFKVALNLNFPFAQSKYNAKYQEIKESMKIIDNERKIQLIEIETDLQTVINSLNQVAKNIDNSIQEITLLKQLEKLEKKKYDLGSSTLFLLNQRETLTMNAQKMLLKFQLEYQLLHQTYKRIINDTF